MAELSAPAETHRDDALLSRDIRVAHVIVALTVGGAETALKRLVLATPHSERLLVVSLTEIGPIGEELLQRGIRVEALHMRGSASAFAAMWRLTRLLRAFRADIVQTWMYHADLLGGLAARFAGIHNVVWGIRNTDLQAGVAGMTRVLASVASRLSHVVPRAIVCVAESAKVSHAEMGYDETKMVVIRNGVDVAPVGRAISAKAAELRRTLAIPPSAFVVGGVGRYNHYKDWENFVRAAGLIAQLHSDVHFVLVGRGLDSENKKLAAWICAAGLDGRVSLLGERGDVGDCLTTFDAFVLSSRSEGFPNVVAEAMSAELPCIVTDVGDASVLVGDAGVVVPKEDAQRLAEGVTRVMSMSRDLRRVLGGRARDRVMQDFSIKRMSEQYVALYTSLMASK